jgi:small-conductance mechanosensitive channel
MVIAPQASAPTKAPFSWRRVKMPSHRVKLALIIIACWIAWCSQRSVIWAGEAAKTPPQASETKPVAGNAVAIADSEIIPRAEQTVKRLQRLKLDAGADASLRTMHSEFADFAEKSDKRRESEAEILSKTRSVQRFNELLREWKLEQSQLEGWEQALAKKSQALIAQEQEIDRIVEIWRATQAAVAKKFFFKAVLQRRVDEVLQEAQAARAAIQAQTSSILKLQNQIADRLATLANIRKEIDQAKEDFNRRLFTLDSPPLWQALLRPEAPETIIAEASDSRRTMLSDSRDFVDKYGERIFLHLVFFLAILALFFYLRRGLTPEVAERLGATSAIVVLDHAVSSSMLLALLPSGLIYPGAAAGILRSVIMPTVIPVMLLLPELLPQLSRRRVYLLAALYLLEFFRYLLPEDWLLTRLLLLVTATAACAGIGLFLRVPQVKLPDSLFRARLIVFLLRFLLFLFALSVVCNVFGNMSLADILVAVPVRISYAGFLIFVAAELLITLTVVALQSPAARWLRSVREHGELLVARSRLIIRLGAIALWSGVSLSLIGVLGDILTAAEAFLQMRWKVGATEISVEGVALFFAVLVSAILLARLVRFFLTEEIFPRIHLPRGVPGAVDVLARYGVLLLGFLIALAAAGVDFSKVTLLISALGVGIGFGLQNVVNNFVSGLILVFEHPVQVGDFVEVGTTFGEVRKIGFRASVLRTPDGADIIIPNSELVSARFANWSLSDWLRRINISVSVAYGTDPNRVIDILVGVARKHPAVLADPAPLAVFDRFGDSALSFTLHCWSFVDRFYPARSELITAINQAFDEAGIQIPFPQQDVHVHWPDGASGAGGGVAPKDQTAGKPTDPGALLAAGRPAAKT